jgi:hypothetical protein
MNTSFRVEVSFTDEASNEVISLLKEVGATKVQQVKQYGFTGIEEIVLVSVLVVSALANLVIKLVPLWKCGVEVDARGSTILTRKNCDLPRGTVLIIRSDDTKVELHAPSEIDIQSIIKAAIPNQS